MAKHRRVSGDWLELEEVQPSEENQAPDWVVVAVTIVLFVAFCAPAVVLRFQ